MNSNVLNQLGLGGMDIGIVLIVLAAVCLILLVLVIVALAQIQSFRKKYAKFMQGKNAASLEKNIMALHDDNVFIKENVEKNQKDIEELYKKHELAFQKMGLVKYDAFKEMGGKLSFTLALLDEKNNGVLINSVHSSDGCYSYTKRVKNGDSSIALSNEEKVAIERAIQGTASNPDAE